MARRKIEDRPVGLNRRSTVIPAGPSRRRRYGSAIFLAEGERRCWV